MAGRRSNRAVPAFSGNNLIHSNPLPPVSSRPSFSYGSPQSVLPKPLSARDTKVAINDALEQANQAAKARLEQAAQDRRLAEQRAAEDAASTAAAIESTRQTSRQSSAEPSINPRKRSLRSQSVLSQDDTFYEGDETSLEIHRIIESARNPVPESSMLRARSANAGTKEPRSAMKGSREEALRPSAKTRARHTASARRTVPMTPIPIDGEREATFDEENQGIGLAPRLASPSFVSPSPTPDPAVDPPLDHGIFGNRQESPPDTVGYAEDIIPSSTNPNKTTSSSNKAKPFPSASRRAPSWLSLFYVKTGFRSAISGIKKTVLILGIFAKNLFGPLLNYLLLGFFIFVITALSYNFIQRSSYNVSFPVSSEDASRRLIELEKQVFALSRAHNKGAKQWESLSQFERNSQKGMEQQVASMKSVIAAYSSISVAFDKHTRAYQTDKRSSATSISTMAAQMEQLDKSIKRNDAIVNEYKVNSQLMLDNLNKFQSEVKGIDLELQRLSKSQQLTEDAIRSIEANLPKQIAARLDPNSGQVVVAPELLRYLQTLLRTESQGNSGTGRTDITYDWDEFIKINAAKMKGYLGTMSEENWGRAIADGIVLPREEMMRVIREQLESVRGIAERDNKDLMKRLKLEAENAANNAISTAATSISSAALAAASNYMRNFKGGSSSSQYADALIQAALHQYSATILQKPDYALLARGTLIDPRLTSSTFDPYGSPGLFGVISSLLRPGPNEPAHVLTESTNVGDCWSFPQTSGQVSLLLAEPIYPTDVTIDHVPRGISGDDSSAPREVEFWVHIEDEFVRTQVSKAATVAIGDVSDGPMTHHYLANGYIRVASFIYDINNQYPVQTFELPVELEKIDVSVRRVSFRVLNNWGNEEYTSIYRLRVHGNPRNKGSEGPGSTGHSQDI